MTNAELQITSINSAQKYYDYLKSKEKGVIRIEVREKKEVDGKIQLMLSKKLRDFESIEFEIRGQMFTPEMVSPILYDEDRNCLVVRPKAEIRSSIAVCTPDDIVIISDLKYLVKRVENWYKKNGNTLGLPQHAHQINKDTISFLEPVPSGEQIHAIYHVLSSPYSYVWGAPGTGKTQLVLANCVLYYAQQHRRILIVAPTNNSVEQVLRGVIPLLDSAGIPRKKIIRLGTPSKSFANRFPEVCEDSELQKKMMQIQQKRDNLTTVLKLREMKKRSNQLEDEIIPCVVNVCNLADRFSALKNNSLGLNETLSRKEMLLQNTKNQIHDLTLSIKVFEQKKEKLTFKVSAFVNPKIKVALKEKLQSSYAQLTVLDQSENNYNNEIQTLNNRLLKTDNDVDDARQNLLKHISILQQLNIKSKTISSILSELNVDNTHKTLKNLEDKLAEGNEYVSTKEAELALYGNDTEAELQQEIDDLNDEYDLLIKSETATRVQNAYVVGATLDGYIARISPKASSEQAEDNKLYRSDFEHVFVDEAGYCNMIKGATVLSQGCPVTYLGDHMQLPPVCEMSDHKICSDSKDVTLWAQSILHVESLFKLDLNQICEDYINVKMPPFQALSKYNLKKGYRFGDFLAKILDKHVYNNAYAALSFKVTILDAKGQSGRNKRENPAEARAIQQYLYKNAESIGSYVIITPYTNQVRLLGEYLPKEHSQLQVMTVHAAQGREWDTVILSVSDHGNDWFTDSENSVSKGLMVLNTAISRSKNHFVLVCDVDYWKYRPRQLISAIIHNSQPPQCSSPI